MASCEKCWRDSRGQYKSQYAYSELIKERKDNPCTPEEQAGIGSADVCKACKRKTIHTYCNICMNPECSMYYKEINHDQIVEVVEERDSNA